MIPNPVVPTAACKPSKLDVVGVHISTTSYDEVANACASWIATDAPEAPARYICVTSVHGVMEARKDDAFRSILNGADIATPDGMPLVWALRSFGQRHQQRVYGPNLMLVLCEQAARMGHRIFIYGGRWETLEILRTKLLERFPKLIISGSYSPPFRQLTASEDRHVCRLIREATPHLIFVGISTPKQELWMYDHRSSLSGTVMVGVGAALDFHSGRIKQAPGWMQRNGLEWFFRLTREPTRLWRRYLLITPTFLPCWAAQKARLTIHAMLNGRSSGVSNV